MSTKNKITRCLRPGLDARVLLAILIAGTLRSAFGATEQLVFKSPEQAVEALYEAVETDDQEGITHLLGPLASSDDIVQDKTDRERFIRKYLEMHRLVKEADGTTVLYIGAENWPFPVPLVSNQNEWRFDVDAGASEMMFRRIGENETIAIETSRAIAQAITHPRVPANNAEIDQFASQMVNAGNRPSEIFHGYLFRVIAAPKGPTVIAYPSEYGSTGVMTFATTSDGDVHERDFGPNTNHVAQSIVRYKTDRTWRAAEQ